MGTEKPMHIVMFPWLAIGHLIPFHHLSKCLAQRGHKVSFISTPRNLERLPTTPSHLAPFIHLVSLPLPKVENLPHHAESSMDIPHHKAQFLKIAFDNLESPLAKFLQNSNPFPDWIIYDYASHWLPRIVSQLKISSAYLSLFTAATMAFIGPPSVILSGGREFNPEAVTVSPNWVPFQSDVVYRPHEIMKYSDGAVGNESGKLYNKPVISIGVLPPEMDGGDQAWIKIKEWLDEQRVNSVIYVALGTEATLSQTELRELATGLEKCGLPFFWVLRNPPGSTRGYSEMLPTGFTDRVGNRGVKVGVEIPRDERDGSFTSDAVAESVELAVLSEEGESLRANARRMKGLFGDGARNGSCMDSFVSYLRKNKTKFMGSE
nr:UDP-glycosyltransferase 91C1 [Ipomoea batatas]GMC54380.1 UDP-glycosyltransferase 91C1 [Ipomoea batatas]GMC55112.1 UDP-glycosyltransferase 91C1 [Ipomoea batatas]